MSLTSLIETDKELRDEIKAAFSRPKLEKNKPLLVEPLTKNNSLVGTAFDYIFRFYLERLNSINNYSRQWIAEEAITRPMFNKEVYKEVYEVGVSIVNNVKKLKKEFIETGELSEELIRQTLRMSHIDNFSRAGVRIENIGVDAEKGDIEDIKKQFNLIDEKLFIAQDICILNPTFGEASILVGGADADLIIDNKLIDIKTTKKLEFKLNDFCQVIGYFLLHIIDGINERKELEINQLGIYYSRYGYLFLFNTKDLIDDSSLQKFTEWFVSRINQKKDS